MITISSTFLKNKIDTLVERLENGVDYFNTNGGDADLETAWIELLEQYETLQEEYKTQTGHYYKHYTQKKGCKAS